MGPMQNIDVTVEVKHELGDISRDLFIESADYTCRCRKLNQWDACPLCRHSCGWSVSKSSGIMWRRLTHIQGQLLAALTDILCYQIPAKIASCQDQQPTTPASTQATVPQRDCYSIYPEAQFFREDDSHQSGVRRIKGWDT